MSTSPTASAFVEPAARRLAERRGAPRRPADPEDGDVEPVPEVEDPAHAGVGDERALRGRVVDEARGHEALGQAADRVGDPPERLAVRAGGPVAAAQRDHGRAGLARAARRARRRARRPTTRRRRRRPRRRGPRPAAPRRQAGRPSAGRRPRVPGGSARDGRPRGRKRSRSSSPAGTGLGGLVDDPDLDDALGAGPLQEPRDLRPGDAEQLRDRVTASRPARSRAGSRRSAAGRRTIHGSVAYLPAHLHDTDVQTTRP